MTDADTKSQGSHESEPSDVSDAPSDALAGAQSAHAPVAPSSSSTARTKPDAQTKPDVFNGVFSKTPWLRSTDGAEIKNELRDVNICKVCNTAVPIGEKRCPNCAKFVKGNAGRRSRKADVETILAELLREYRPQTTVLKETCEHLAKTLAELKTMVAGSLEWSRVHDITQRLTITLEESRAKRVAASAENGAPILTEVRRVIVHPKSVDGRTYESHRSAAGPSAQAATATSSDAVAPATVPAPKPDVICPYCHRACVGPWHDAYDVLHWADPLEIAKRDKAATDEMFQQIGKRLPDWHTK